jgi:hypothetical protein
LRLRFLAPARRWAARLLAHHCRARPWGARALAPRYCCSPLRAVRRGGAKFILCPHFKRFSCILLRAPGGQAPAMSFAHISNVFRARFVRLGMELQKYLGARVVGAICAYLAHFAGTAPQASFSRL